MNFKKPKFWDLNKPNFISYILFPLTLIIRISNFFLDNSSPFKNKAIKTICIGNIYIGGTGKTPSSIKISQILNINHFNFGNKISKISNSLKFNNLEEFYFQIIRQDYSFNNIVNFKENSKANFLNNIKFSENLGNLENFQSADLLYYLPDDIFVKVEIRIILHSIYDHLCLLLVASIL